MWSSNRGSSERGELYVCAGATCSGLKTMGDDVKSVNSQTQTFSKCTLRPARLEGEVGMRTVHDFISTARPWSIRATSHHALYERFDVKIIPCAIFCWMGHEPV